ncbi:MAG: hypothetical protein K1X51_15710 [Rhodospirillaceae bacterium]|nr:hypothetical protein [Rhodospirillaceae bacterium]
MKTSLTHPLEIPAVTAGVGRLGMCMCPGKQQPHAATGPWARDLATDMDAITAFEATILITLMEPDELEKATPAARLKAATAERGIAWLHIPIPDLAAPGAIFEDGWKIHGPTVRAALSKGQNVVVHCRGGRGRSGLVAARILVEMGMEPRAAILAVRKANPLAIETPVQEEHVKSLTPL